jgi:hypothetical protein
MGESGIGARRAHPIPDRREPLRIESWLPSPFVPVEPVEQL